MKKLYILTFITIFIGTIFIGTKEVKAQTETDVYYITMYLEGNDNYSETAKGYYNELHQSVTFNGYNELVGLFINGEAFMNTYDFIAYQYYNADTFEYETRYDLRSSVNYTMLTIGPNGYYSNNFGNVTVDITLYRATQYNQGYDTAKAHYGIYYNNQWLTAEEYATIIENNLNVQEYYDNGYNEAKNDYGYNLDGAIVTGQTAYNTGYNEGINETDEIKMSIRDFIPGVLGSLFMFFFQIGQIGILGITLLDILGIVLMVASLVFIIKFFF